jgi:hypothetical protein
MIYFSGRYSPKGQSGTVSCFIKAGSDGIAARVQKIINHLQDNGVCTVGVWTGEIIAVLVTQVSNEGMPYVVRVVLPDESYCIELSKLTIEGCQTWIKFGDSFDFYINQAWYESSENERKDSPSEEIVRDFCAVRLVIPCLSIERLVKLWFDEGLTVEKLRNCPVYLSRLCEAIRSLITLEVYERAVLGLLNLGKRKQRHPTFVAYAQYGVEILT